MVHSNSTASVEKNAYEVLLGMNFARG
jgi:hypothetical protein